MSNAAPAQRLASTFDDEFSVFDASPDGVGARWATELPFWNSNHTLANNDEAEYYVDSSEPNSPFSLDDGVLTIKASAATDTGGNALGLPYNSGVITTYQSFSQLYGYFEVRAQLPSGKGLWPAFWLMPTGFKAGPELDAFEVLGDRPDILYASVHSADPAAALEQPLRVADTSAGFHTYGVDWGPQTTVFYMDGQAIASVATPADMDVPMYMLLNLAVGGVSSWPGAPDAQTQFPADMRFDDVRVYQTAATIGWTDPAPRPPDPLVLPALEASVPAGNASAYVFVEHYGNGDGGSPLGGIGVALRDAAGLIVATGVTEASGFYTFSNVASGTYSVEYVTPDEYSVRPGGFADASTGATPQFTLSAGQSYGVPYQLVTSNAELAGTVQVDGSDAADVPVELIDEANGTRWQTDTDASGRFDFWVAAGQYAVRYDAPAGTADAPGGLADAATGLTPPIVLADGQSFLLIPEQLVSTGGAAVVSAPAGDLAVFRFFDAVNGTQFLTASAAERDTVVATRPDLIPEGVGIDAVDGSNAGAVPVFRFFDTHSGTHFYTSSSTERDGLVQGRPDLTYEGVSFYEHQTTQPGDAPVYRFFDSNHGTHFYTSSESEYATVLASRPDLIPEGVAFYSPTLTST